MPKIEQLDEPGLYRLTFPMNEEDPEESVWNAYLSVSDDTNFLKVYSASGRFVGVIRNPTPVT